VIQGLVDAAVARVRDELAGVLPPGTRVVAGPAAEPSAGELPLLVLSPGRWEAAPAPPETGEGEARPRETRQRIEPLADAGPYPLDHLPLPGSARARLVLAEGTVAERTEPLVEGHDFEIDVEAAALTLLVDLAGHRAAHAARVAAQVQARVGRAFNLDSPRELSAALFTDLGLPTEGEPNEQGFHSTARRVLEPLRDLHPVIPLVLAYRELKAGSGGALLVDHAFAAVFTVREFRQALELDAYAADAAGAERWASLAAASLLTRAGALCDASATDHPSRRTVSTRHEVTRIELGEGEMQRFEAGVRLRTVFQARGRLTFAREEPVSLAVIRHVRSPGTYSPEPVAVDVEVA
jgi:hypothetical protein